MAHFTLIETPRILNSKASYTFADYFSLNYDAADILADLGCRFIKSPLEFEPLPLDTSFLEAEIQDHLALVMLDSEDARKQALISPLILYIVRYTRAMLKIEYSVNPSPYLRGKIDYFIRNGHHLIIVEAKNADISRGFVQMAVQLLALHFWLPEAPAQLIGAVTTGDSWLFGKFSASDRTIVQDTQIYAVPSQLNQLAAILHGLLRQ
jgi:hypothetical protein